MSGGRRTIPVLRHVDDLKPGEKRIITSSTTGRSIVVVRNPKIGERPLFFVMDALCYHMGGPLGINGTVKDIEDVGPVIVCPSHNHVISLHSGGVVQAGNCAPLNKSFREPKCRKQRTHKVHIDGDGKVWAIIDSAGEPVASDKYNILVGVKRRQRTLGRSFTLDGAPAAKKRSSANNHFLSFRARKMHATAAIRKKMALSAGSKTEAQNTIPSMFASISSSSGSKRTFQQTMETKSASGEIGEPMSAAHYFRHYQHTS